MSTIPKKPNRRDERYLQFVDLQLRNLSDKEIARHFNRGSARDVYEELRGYGFPVCPRCGTTPVGADHCRKLDRGHKTHQVVSETQELPPLDAAAPLFEEALEKLSQTVGELRHYRETYTRVSEKSSRFDATYEAPGTFIPPGEGRLIQEAYAKEFLGGAPKPENPWVTLVAAYFLAGMPVLPLVEKLNIHPDEVDIEAIERLVREGDRSLLHVVSELAAAVRYGETSKGRPADAAYLSAEEHRQRYEKTFEKESD